MGDNHTIQHITSAPIMAIPFTTPDGSFTVEFCVE
jgi:chemotaxis protein CheX